MSFLTKNKNKPISIKKLKSNLPKTVQQSLPFLDMRKDGICMVSADYYTKTMQFDDINYKLASQSEQEAIYAKYCNFLNQFEHDIEVQFSFQNKVVDTREFGKYIELPKRTDQKNLADIRVEYEEMLRNQLEKGNNGIRQIKYITFGVHETSFKKAKFILERVEQDIKKMFKTMKVSSHTLSGYERLKLLKESLFPCEIVPFNFDWKRRYLSGMSVKDYISPTSFDFTRLRNFRMGNTYGAAYYVYIDAAEISDRIIEDIMAIDSNIHVNIHTHSMEQQKALKFVSYKLTNANAIKIKKQSKAAQHGYDGDIMSMDLVNDISSAQNIYQDLSQRNNRFFITTLLVTAYSKNPSELSGIEKDISSILQKYKCELRPLDDMQEEGAMSSLPIGINMVEINRSFTTIELAAFMPFTTQELFMPYSVYYGLNSISNNMILLNRKALKNGNGLILGVPGGGKSFFAKREITDVFFRYNDNIIICDPEAEYVALVKKLGGEIIDISATSQNHINPFDINLRSYEKGDDPVAIKSQFILSMCEAAIGEISAGEKSVIDRCVRKIYDKYINDPKPENMPIFEDLYNELRKTESVHARNVADGLELYVTGSLSIFNHRTNIDINNRVICFDIKKLSEHLHKIGLLIITDYVWNKVSEGRDKKKYTWYYVDEFHKLLEDNLTAIYTKDMWKRFRKWHAIPTGITQNVSDFLISPQAEAILKNSQFICMLEQDAGDANILATHLKISPQQLEYVLDCDEGEGLIYFNKTIIPFKDKFPNNTLIYKLITTKASDDV